MKTLLESDKFELKRSCERVICGTEKEILFARKVKEYGLDYSLAAEYGINNLNLNKNALNSAYNQVSIPPTVGLKYI
jgi:hypothetical protein